jgi:ferrous iron transport protein B
MKPIGLGDWRIVTSLISGFMAKESVVSIMTTLFGNGLASLGSLAAASMLAFSLLYTPCVAAVAAIRREMGGKWAAGVVLWQCVIAWVAALLVRLIGSLF